MRATAIVILLTATLSLPASASDQPYKNTHEASLVRGSVVFNSYCALCHGPALDGNGRAAKLYDPPPANLLESDKNREYMELIVRQGGAAIGRSKFMPPWNEELTDEQISDLLNYVETTAADAVSLAQGRAVYETYCVLCHGPQADGQGRAAKLYTPPPANLVASDKNRKYKELIIRQGGAAIGRSEFMPPWDEELSAVQVAALLDYLESLSTP